MESSLSLQLRECERARERREQEKGWGRKRRRGVVEMWRQRAGEMEKR